MSRCDRCNRLKFFGKGWEIDHSWAVPRLYCPKCWELVVAQKRAEKEEVKRLQKHIELEFDGLLQQAKHYASEDASLPEGLAAAITFMANYVRKQTDIYNPGSSLRKIKESNSPDYSQIQDLRKLQEELNEELKPYRAVLGRIDEISRSLKPDARVDELVDICLNLADEYAEVENGKLVYGVNDSGRPLINVLVQLSQIDRKATLTRLQKTACKYVYDADCPRHLSVLALKEIGEWEDLKPLLSILQNKDVESTSFNHCVVCVIIDKVDEQNLPFLIRAIKERGLSGEEGSYFAECITKLVRPGTDAYEELLGLWEKHKKDWGCCRGVNYEIEGALMTIRGPEALDIAIENALSGICYTRALRGTKVLATFKNEKALDVLCNILTTASALETNHDPDYTKFEDNTQHRITAAHAIARIGGEKAQAALKQVASSENDDAKVKNVARKLLPDQSSAGS